jgi:putative acetyltransferase
MGNQAMSVALRPYLPADARRCAAIFRSAIEEIASEDYSEGQCEAWARQADDEAAFGQSLAAMLTLIATEDGEPIGFASLKGADLIEMVYVDPQYARRGVGAALLDALERIARGRGAKKLAAEVSDTAKPLFDRRQFVSERRNVKRLDEEWLGNTSMSKALDAAPTEHGKQPG